MAIVIAFDLDPTEGGRISSLRVDDQELLVTDRRGGAMSWGCYPMVPFAGRLRRGAFRFAGRDYTMPANLGPHAIHGTGFTLPWDVEPDGTLALELGPPWPFGGSVRHRVRVVDADTVTATLEVHADQQSMPAQAGWHPWFLRPVSLMFAPGAMYRRDDDGIPDGTLLRPPPRAPWDDCFTEVAQPLELWWHPSPRLRLTSSCDHWVVFDHPTHAICVEPQTGPPDGFNLAPFVVEPGHPLVATFTFQVAAGSSSP